MRYFIIGLFFLLGIMSSCSTLNDYDPSPLKNYDALWKILDEGYCYFDEKLPTDSTWQDMYLKHLPKIHAGMSQDSLFDVMSDLLAELKDGHVNLFSPFDLSRYSKWHSDYPTHLNTSVRNRYLGNKYRIAGGLYYAPIKYLDHEKDSIGYIVYNSFASSITLSNIASAFVRLKSCKALIIDIRNNGGGNLNYSTLFASHFAPQRTLTGYMRHKTGPGHKDFSPPSPVYIDTLKQGVKWFRPVVVLVNRGVYSAANDFAVITKELPYVTLMGDKTGGGGGLPTSSELPNGWAVRYSSSILTDARDRSIEFGIDPHYPVSLKEEDVKEGKDTLIEEAIVYLNNRIQRSREKGYYEK